MPAPARAAAIPDLLVEARRVVNTVMNGWHGRRKRGPGENFWQFRPYVEGESLARIDWRRSARDDHTYVRDREWESAHTVWLWSDFSPSMLYRSRLAPVSKEARALVLTLALAELLSRSGERIAFPELMQPFSARNGAERLAGALMHEAPASALPDIGQIRRFSEVVLISDFLHPFEDVTGLLDRLAKRGVRAHLVEIADPAEETFPIPAVPNFATRRQARPSLRAVPKPTRRTIAAFTSPVAKPSSISARGSAGAIRSTGPTGRRRKRWHDFTTH